MHVPVYQLYQPAARKRPELLEQKREGEHVWTTVVAFVSSTETVTKAFENHEMVLLDAENIAEISTGCYICEEPFSIRLSHRRCKGEPNDSIKYPGA